MRKRIIFTVLIVIFTTSLLFAKKIVINTDDNWFPFTFKEKGKSIGVHIDILTQALKNLGYEVEFKPYPWKRCLVNVESGDADAILSASYKDKRAVFATYPPDAKTAKKSKNRVTQVEYVLITLKENPFEYGGDMKKIPAPARVQLGYSVGDDIKKGGVKIEAAKSPEQNLAKLLRDKKGSVVMNPLVAKTLTEKKDFAGKFKIHSVPVKSKSYYMIFSKKTKLTADDMKKIWDEIAKVRDNQEIMLKIYSTY